MMIQNLNKILCLIVLAFSAVLPLDAAAQAGNSIDYINATKQHINALNDSIDKYCRDSVALQHELDKLPKGNVDELTKKLNACVADTISLSSQLDTNTQLLDSITLKRIALNDSLLMKVTKFTNNLLNTPCNPEAIKSLESYRNYPILKENEQIVKNIEQLNAYEDYSSQLMTIVKPLYEALDRNGWQPLAESSEVLKTFNNNLKNYKKNIYKNFGKENDNIPLLDRTIQSLEKHSDTRFGDTKNTLDEIIFNLTPCNAPFVSPVETLNGYNTLTDSLNTANRQAQEKLAKKHEEITKLKRDITVNGDGKRLALVQKLNAIHIKCDDMRELKDIAIFKECLFINLKQPYNDTIITALRPYAKETFFKSYQEFQEPYLPIIDNYGTYTDSLYIVMRDCYNNYCRKAGWKRLPSDILKYVRHQLTSQEYYKMYYLRKDKVNSPHLNDIISEYLKLLDSGFANCKTQYVKLLTKLRGKAPKIKKQSNSDPPEENLHQNENQQ